MPPRKIGTDVNRPFINWAAVNSGRTTRDPRSHVANLSTDNRRKPIPTKFVPSFRESYRPIINNPPAKAPLQMPSTSKFFYLYP